jgi:hypothetical protein
MPHRAVVALDAGVLLGLARLDMQDGNPLFPGPFDQLSTDVFRAVIHPFGAGLAAPFDDPIQAADHAPGGKRKVYPDPQTVAVEVVRHVHQPERPTLPQMISHEVHRPGHVGRFWHRQGVGFVPLQPLAGLDA